MRNSRSARGSRRLAKAGDIDRRTLCGRGDGVDDPSGSGDQRFDASDESVRPPV